MPAGSKFRIKVNLFLEANIVAKFKLIFELLYKDDVVPFISKNKYFINNTYYFVKYLG